VAEAAAGTAFIALCLAQLAFVFAVHARGESLFASQISRNPYVWMAVAFSAGLMLLGTFIAPLAAVLSIVPPDPEGWLMIGLAAVTPAILATIGRAIR
ncbi:MAG: cation-translocating P-type ATPase C-terminal domain-containing protein, partial [Pseudomonadota bacterium]